MQSGDPVSALKQALALERPHAAWGCLKAIHERSTGEATLDPFDEAFSDLELDQSQKLLTAIVDWNANARRAPIAQRALRALIKAHGADTLLKDAALSDAVAAYTKRHLARLDGLLQQTYLVDSVLGALERRCLTVEEEPAPAKRPRAAAAPRVYTADAPRRRRRTAIATPVRCRRGRKSRRSSRYICVTRSTWAFLGGGGGPAERVSRLNRLVSGCAAEHARRAVRVPRASSRAEIVGVAPSSL